MKSWKAVVVFAVIFNATVFVFYMINSWLVGYGFFKAHGLALYEHDFLVYGEQKLCFRHEGDAKAIISPGNIEYINNNTCLSGLPYGNFTVSISAGDKKIWFAAERRSGSSAQMPNRIEIAAQAAAEYNIPVEIRIKNNLGRGRVFLVTIYDGNSSLKSFFARLMPGEEKTFAETLRLGQGSHALKAALDTGESAIAIVDVKQNNAYRLADAIAPFGAALIFAPCLLLLRKKHKGFGLFAYSMLLSLSMLVLFSAFIDIAMPFPDALLLLLMLTTVIGFVV